MIGQIFPLFQNGRLLRKEMLEAFSDYSYRFGELLHINYSNGIISGCKLSTTKETIVVNPGLLCFHGKIFLVKEPVEVPYYPTNTLCALKVNYLGEVKTDSFISYEMEMVLSGDITVNPAQIELCRFTLQPGAYLRCEYVDFEDRSTDYDTLNTIYTPYAASGESTLSPELTKAFATELFNAQPENQIDISFCLQLLGSTEPICKEALVTYIHYRTGSAIVEKGNQDIYKALLKILREVKQGNHMVNKASPKQLRKILVD